MDSMSLLSQIKENWSSIRDGADLRAAIIITAIFIVGILHEVFCIQNINPVYELIDLLFPALIGALTTIIALVFAGMIFLVSFDSNDNPASFFAYNDGEPYSIFSFHIRWSGVVGCFGIITCICTVFMRYFGCDPITLIFLILSLFLFIYVITSIISLCSLLTIYGKFRLELLKK